VLERRKGLKEGAMSGGICVRSMWVVINPLTNSNGSDLSWNAMAMEVDCTCKKTEEEEEEAEEEHRQCREGEQRKILEENWHEECVS
jgi:hypothetical protein